MRIKLPFYPNLESNTHCYQASLKIVLKYFFPEKDFSYEELDAMSNHDTKYWTWMSLGLVSLKKLGLKVKYFADFDFRKFAKKGEKYIYERHPKEDADTIIAHTADLKMEQENGLELLKSRMVSRKKVSLRDIEKEFSKGKIPIFLVNSRILNNREGFSGHFVVLTGIDKNYVWIHDPGLPPKKDRKVSRKLFEKAWHYPKNEYDVALVWR